MSKELRNLEKLMHIYSPAQVAVWLGLNDPRPIHQWILRNKIPRTKQAKVTLLLENKGSDRVRIIRRPKGKKERAV